MQLKICIAILRYSKIYSYRMKRNLVVIGFFGARQDTNSIDSPSPTLHLCRAAALGPELPALHRLELLCGERDAAKAARFVDEYLRPTGVEVRLHSLTFRDSWNLARVNEAVFDFVSRYAFDHTKEEYLAHLSVGSEVKKITLFLHILKGLLRARLLHTIPQPGGGARFAVTDLHDAEHQFLRLEPDRSVRSEEQWITGGIETRNARYQHLVRGLLTYAVRSDQPVLLMGETGVGKSYLARRIFEQRQERAMLDKQAPFVDVNCATLLPDRAVADLFGAAKGAYTGASADRPGYLEAANGGLLFLDEIGELAGPVQAMLLKAIEEKSFYPLGATKKISSNFQLICATNRELRAEVTAGRFREDLYARLRFWSFVVPPLRDRVEDIEPLMDRMFDERAKRLSSQVTFGPAARQRFLRFARSGDGHWRANYRDLQFAVERLAARASDGLITASMVDAERDILREEWQGLQSGTEMEPVGPALPNDLLGKLCLSDRIGLEHALGIIRRSRNLAEAGRRLFEPPDGSAPLRNPSDRVIKYLRSFGLDRNSVLLRPTDR